MAVVVNATNETTSLFVDGCLEGTKTMPVPAPMLRLRGLIGKSTWDPTPQQFSGAVFGLRIWNCARTHTQLRAARAADVACEDDALGLGLDLARSEFVDKFSTLASEQVAQLEAMNPDGAAASLGGSVLTGGSSVVPSTGRASTLTAASSMGGSAGSVEGASGSVHAGASSLAAAARHAAQAGKTQIHPKFTSLAALAELFHVPPEQIDYPLSLDPRLTAQVQCHPPLWPPPRLARSSIAKQLVCGCLAVSNDGGCWHTGIRCDPPWSSKCIVWWSMVTQS